MDMSGRGLPVPRNSFVENFVENGQILRKPQLALHSKPHGASPSPPSDSPRFAPVAAGGGEGRGEEGRLAYKQRSGLVAGADDESPAAFDEPKNEAISDPFQRGEFPMSFFSGPEGIAGIRSPPVRPE